jgi:Ca2+-binding EF-hand superfamily protein
MTEDEIRELIEEADIDDNGVIDYNEFYSMMDQKPKSTPK